MSTTNTPKTPPANEQGDEENSKFPGYPPYPSNEDVFNRHRIEEEIDPDDITQLKAPNEKPDTMNEKNFLGHISGSDLDIPGAELDDEQEMAGSEDEENNSWSLGGDNHESLEENQG